MADTAVSLNNETYITEFGIPILNIWYMLLYAWDESPTNWKGEIGKIEDAPSLDALLSLILMKLIQQRFRIGLGRSYLNKNDVIRGIRGHIDFSNSLKFNTFEHGQVYCDFQEFSQNAPKNQIIKSTFLRVIRTGYFGPDSRKSNDLRQKLRLTVKMMDGIEIVEINQNSFNRLALGRNEKDYKLMLAICELLYKKQMPTESTGSANIPSIDHVFLEEHQIFEKFIANFYKSKLRGWRVEAQKQFDWHEEPKISRMPIMRPDLVLQENSSGRIIILDTKFTAKSLVQNRWENVTFASGHLYQLYTYLNTQQHLSEKHLKASGILLYPEVNKSSLSDNILLPNHKILIQTIDLSRPWVEIETELIKLIQQP